MNDKTPDYLKIPIPSLQRQSGYRSTNVIETIFCSVNTETRHFLLKCPGYNEHRHLLFQTLNPILLANDINHRNDCELVKPLLYGHEKLKFLVNQLLLKATVNFIGKTLRFS